MKVFEVIENNKVIFEGTAEEICNKFNIKSKGYVWKSAKKGYSFGQKYIARFKGYRQFVVEIRNIYTNEIITGYVSEIAKKLLLDESYVVYAAKRNKLLLQEWKIRLL